MEREMVAKDYLKQPYSRVLIPDPESGTYTAQVLEFPGCIAQGDTPEEAYRNLEDAAESWIEVALDQRIDVPEPLSQVSYGGKIALRLPKSLHRQAAAMAEREGVSLNQFLVVAISEKVGERREQDRLQEQLIRVVDFITASSNLMPSSNRAQVVCDLPLAISAYKGVTTSQRIDCFREVFGDYRTKKEA